MFFEYHLSIHQYWSKKKSFQKQHYKESMTFENLKLIILVFSLSFGQNSCDNPLNILEYTQFVSVLEPNFSNSYFFCLQFEWWLVSWWPPQSSTTVSSNKILSSQIQQIVSKETFFIYHGDTQNETHAMVTNKMPQFNSDKKSIKLWLLYCSYVPCQNQIYQI